MAPACMAIPPNTMAIATATHLRGTTYNLRWRNTPVMSLRKAPLATASISSASAASFTSRLSPCNGIPFTFERKARTANAEGARCGRGVGRGFRFAE